MNTNVNLSDFIYNKNLKLFIGGILSNLSLTDNEIQILLSDKCLQEFKNSLTCMTFDYNNNYEFYELLGDSTLNKCIIWYLKRRFPEFNRAGGVKYLTRLKIITISKEGFSSLADTLGLYKYIRSSPEEKQNDKKKILEDVFEAFLGCLEHLVDEHIKLHKGYSIVYQLIEQLLDKKEFNTKYEDLWDAKTRIKELFDIRPNDKYWVNFTAIKKQGETFFNCIVSVSINNKVFDIGSGIGRKKANSEQIACEDALKNLKNSGIFREFE